MGRPPSNGGPSFRFNQAEIAEMEAILQAHKIAMPERQVLVSLAEKFTNSEERSGKIEVQMKQVWNWFQNRRYAIRAKAAKSPGKLNITQMARDDPSMVKGAPQAAQPHVASSATVRSLPQQPQPQHQHPTVPSASLRTFPQAPQHPPAFSVQTVGRVTEYSQMEYEAKSARDGAWYDVSTFLSHRSLETGDPEALVRFAGFGAEEDEWVNIRKNVRQRSLPCESSECVAVLPADLILCFQEGKEQALYFDAHVLDAQRRRHDVRGCRCRFLVRYDHDQSEEIVALRKICRRPETDYRLQQLHAVNESLSANQTKNGATNNIHTLRVYPPAEVQPKQHKVEPMVQPSTAQVQPKQHKVEPVVQPSLAEAPLKRQRLDSPEVSQKQFTVETSVQQNQQIVQQPVEPEPVVPPPSAEPEPKPVGEVQVEVQKVQPVVPAPSDQTSQEVEPMVSVSSAQDSVELPVGEVQVEEQKVQPVVSAQSDQTSQEVEPMVPVLSAQDSAEVKNAVPVGEVQVEVQEVQPVMHDSSTEVPHKAETAKDEVETVGPTVLLSTEVSVEGPIESLVGSGSGSGSAGEVQTGLHEVQADVPDQPHTTALEPNESNVAEEAKTEEPVGPVSTTEPIVAETKTEEPVGPVSTNEPIVVETKTEEPMVVNSTNDPNEAKTEEPVLTNDPDMIKAEIEEPKLMDIEENVNGVDKVENSVMEEG